MNYAELVERINDTLETTFSTAQVNAFIESAEQFIYNTANFPAAQDTSTGTITANAQYISVPSGFIGPKDLSLYGDDSVYHTLLLKDDSFIREAFPDPTSTGRPRYYAVFDENTIKVGPSSDAEYNLVLTYYRYPESIVTAGTTWLGDTFGTALLDAALLEAARFNKLEPDIIQTYSTMLEKSLMVMKSTDDNRLRTDTYRK